MLRHVVLLGFKDSTSAEVIAGITESLHALAPQISTVRKFSVNATPSRSGVMSFTSGRFLFLCLYLTLFYTIKRET